MGQAIIEWRKVRASATNSVLCGVPEHNALLKSLGLAEGVHDSVGEVAPLVLGPHVGKVDEVVDRQSQTQASRLPRARAQLLAGNLACRRSVQWPQPSNHQTRRVRRCSPKAL